MRTHTHSLFREWDKNNDGQVSREEFRRAMPLLGLEVAVSEIDKLFNEWDVDGGGKLAYKELAQILRSKPAAHDPSRAQKGKAGLKATATAVTATT